MPIWFTAHADFKSVTGSGSLDGLVGTQFQFDVVINPSDMMHYEISPRPLLVPKTRKVAGFIRSDGQMYDTEAVSAAPYDLDDPGQLGVRLLANDPALELDRLQYLVTVVARDQGQSLPLDEFYFDAPSDDRDVFIPLEAPLPDQPFGRGRPGFAIASAYRDDDGLLVFVREDLYELDPVELSAPPASIAYALTFGR